jgi:DNA invertase Pin-like site-specific DNA recombinase
MAGLKAGDVVAVSKLDRLGRSTRELIRERTGEGRKRAMAAGVKFGRKRKLSDYQRAEAIKRRAAGETLASIANSYGVHLAMISRLSTSRN